MTQIHAYLTFSGNCREAMNFYKDCLGGELKLQTVGQSPLADKMPAAMKDCILHGTLSRDGFVLMGSDMVSDKGLIKGNSVSMAINCSSGEEISSLYQKLSAGGHKDHALEETFWGASFGDLTDKYGNHWLLNFEKKTASKKNTVAPKNVDAYLKPFPQALQAKLQQLRQTIIKAAPQAEETMSYGMPAYKCNGMLVYFAGYKNHIGFYPGAGGVAAFKEKLGAYKLSRGTVQFPVDKPVPLGLVTKIVKFRLRQNQEKAAAKKKPAREQMTK